MSNSRRNFIKSVATASAVSTLPVTGAVLACDNKDTEQLSGVAISPFKEAVGTKAVIADAEGTQHTVLLSEVEEMPFECQQHRRPSYLPACANVVRFELDDVSNFTNEVYQLKHPALGKMDVLMAVVPDAGGKLGLEAVFN